MESRNRTTYVRTTDFQQKYEGNSWRKDNGAGTIGYSQAKMNLDLYVTSAYTKINSKWVVA